MTIEITTADEYAMAAEYAQRLGMAISRVQLLAGTAAADQLATDLQLEELGE